MNTVLGKGGYRLNVGGFHGVTDVYLTDVGKTWLQKHYPQGIAWEYDPDKPFKLHSWALDFILITYLGISYRIPNRVDGKPTIRRIA